MKNKYLLFLISFFSSIFNYSFAQGMPNDCVNAIVVCGNGTFKSDASGPGAQPNEVAGCNGSKEHNSVWMKINIIQSGTLGFDLIPNNPDISVDYDFWVYGPNKSCSALGAPIRCCVTNPAQAGLSNNLTGMNGSTIATTAWSGTGGNNLGYVSWLSVTAGQSYYIVIDRPYNTASGDTGFKIQWTGSATQGSGAFPAAPTANKIADYVVCSAESDKAIFDLNSVRAIINSDLMNNTISFYASMANAVDGISPLPNIYENTSNPQTIYAKVVTNIGGCSSMTDFNLKVAQIPTAAISLSKNQVCSGENFTVTFTGTPEATIDYKVNGGATKTVLLDTKGVFVLSQSVTANTTYDLVTAKNINGNNQVVCQQVISDSKTVTVNPLPSVNGPSVVCTKGSAHLIGSGTPSFTNPWVSSDITVATVASDGLVTGVALGFFKAFSGISTATVSTATAVESI